MCDKVLSKEPKYCLDRYKTQEMCNKAFDTFLRTLKIVLNWFVTSEMLGKLDNVIFWNDNIAIHDINSILTFFSDGVGYKTLVILTLIVMKMTLKMLFMLDVKHGVNSANHVKRNHQRINACIMTSKEI